MMRTLITFLSMMIAGLVYAQEGLTVGSKKFTENVILGDIAVHLIKNAGFEAKHQRELGGSRLLWSALLQGDIDVYPEYTGTLTHEILANEEIASLAELRRVLAGYGVKMTDPIGFNNTYAMGGKRQLAERLKLQTISDLAQHPELRFGFSTEFLERADGWPGLRSRYHLPQKSVTGLDHDLAYRGLEAKSLDVIDLYATDAEIRYYDLTILKDDKHYFPDYEAIFIYRDDVAKRTPELEAALAKASGLIDSSTMSALNARAKFDRVPASVVAADFLNQRLQLNAVSKTRSRWSDLITYTKEHLGLVFTSLLFAILFGIPFGVFAAKNKTAGRVILMIVGVVQTIPSLALLVFMIPLLGIGTGPAIVALFLYSLLPIVRNTYQGLTHISQRLKETAYALGLSRSARLFQIELPMALPAIFAGIKTAAVINIGTATLGALVGAGGYGQPILRGIRLDDIELILLGAIPAAILALLMEAFCEKLERWIVPKGLRL